MRGKSSSMTNAWNKESPVRVVIAGELIAVTEVINSINLSTGEGVEVLGNETGEQEGVDNDNCCDVVASPLTRRPGFSHQEEDEECYEKFCDEHHLSRENPDEH